MQKMRFRRLLATVVITGSLGLLFGATALAQADGAAPVVVARVDFAAESTEPGVLIVGVEAESPAAAAGLVRGDIVLTATGEPVNHADDLRAAVRALAPGSTITLTVQHGDDVHELAVKVGERANQAFLGVVPYVARPEGFEAAIQVPAPPSVTFEPFAAGVMTDVITTHVITDVVMGVTKLFTGTQLTGAVGSHVIEVVADSPAAAAGLQPGDVITAINGEELAPELDLAAHIAKFQPDDEITLTVERKGAAEAQELTVTLGEHPEHAGVAYLGVQIAPHVLFFHHSMAARPLRDCLMLREPLGDQQEEFTIEVLPPDGTEGERIIVLPALPAAPCMRVQRFMAEPGEERAGVRVWAQTMPCERGQFVPAIPAVPQPHFSEPIRLEIGGDDVI